jgi:hypothetical protein
MFDDPVEQSFFESDIVPGFLAFQPFVAENLFALGKKLFVKKRFFDEIGAIVQGGTHAAGNCHILESSVNAGRAREYQARAGVAGKQLVPQRNAGGHCLTL